MDQNINNAGSSAALPVSRLSEAQAGNAVAVLCDAFHEYPVMRYIIGPIGGDYDRHLHTLIDLFVMARVWRREPILAMSDGSALVATAILTLPGKRPPPTEFAQHRDAAWRELGQAARMRYEAFGEACQEFDIDQPHYHLNMIGIRRSHLNQGLARQLLDAVHAMSRDNPASSGVTLTTEDPRNVSLYERFGYEIVGHVRINAQLETWGFFRPNDKISPGGFAGGTTKQGTTANARELTRMKKN